MKRDWDVVRFILIELETREDENSPLLVNADYSNPQLVYHLELLIEAKLVNGQRATSGIGPESFDIRRLSWEGHQFLDAIRDETTWAKTKKKVSESGVGMTFEVIKAVAVSITKETLGI